MNLENEQINHFYQLWKNGKPETYHPLDTERFDNLALTLLEHNDIISDVEIEELLGNNANEDIISFYISRFDNFYAIYKLMLNKGYTK